MEILKLIDLLEDKVEQSKTIPLLNRALIDREELLVAIEEIRLNIPEDMNKNYVLKAMTLTAADIKDASANGNKYVVKLGNFANPQKDGKNAMSRATNDFFTHQEVVDGIAGFTTLIKVNSTDIQYTDVTLTATVDGDNLKTLEISYGFSAKMALKAVVTINGQGKATNKMVYTIG